VDGVDFHPDLEVKVFCLTDLVKNSENASFVADSQIIIVDIMDDHLSSYVRDHGLIPGKTVYALRGSKDDAKLVADGFIFSEDVSAYFANLNLKNIANMIRRAASLKLIPDLNYEPPETLVKVGLYHPEAPQLFLKTTDYLDWVKKRPSYDPEAPVLGLMFFETYLMEGQVEPLNELIRILEREKFTVVPVFGSDLPVFENLLLDEERHAYVDVVITFNLKFYLSYNEQVRKAVLDLDIPLFNAIKLYTQTISEWQESPQGIASLDIIWNIDNPETSGVMEPSVLVGKVEEILPNGGVVYHYELIDGMVEHLAGRIHNWIRLSRIPNSEKRIALIYYNNSRGKQNIGASYLNVFRSIASIILNLSGQGYSIPTDPPLTEAKVKELVLRGGRNIGSWAPGELETLMGSPDVVLWPISEYLTYFNMLPESFRSKVIAQWGEPAAGKLMIKDNLIVLPVIRLGNLVILPQGARGDIDDPMKLYHDPVLYPHHQYIAVYLWLKYVFQMDVMIHLGTHGTLEWLPGKEAGLALEDPPEVLLRDIPDIYPYIVDNIGEGLQAKRRGRAVVIDHLTPPLVVAGNYEEYETLKDLIEKYQRAHRLGSPTEAGYLQEIETLAKKLGLEKDLKVLSFLDPEAVEALSIYLEYLETTSVPYGLHTFGVTPSGEAYTSLVTTILAANPGLDPEALSEDLTLSGPNELASLNKALAGGYIESAEGNDPVRNPRALPTGRNFYGISPGLLPTPQAWELGKIAANEIISNYIAEKGTYPSKVAVVLWAVEALRNEGLNEATILALIGVEPVWNPHQQIVGTRPIPGRVLGRPRIDVTIDASGLYRDLFPDKILFIDAAIRQAALQDDVENFIHEGDQKNRTALLERGFSPEEAGRFSRARIFSERPGAYGNRVSELTSASGLWEDEDAISNVFREHTGYAYGEDVWGAPARDSLELNLAGSQVAWHSVSSNTYGVLDNDDMFMFLGGLSLAIKSLSGGVAPETFIADQRKVGAVSLERLDKFIGQETRARYLNPVWIEGMQQEGYAGAQEMSKFVEYLWGWQVTAPEAVNDRAWDEVFEVYVEDKYDQKIPEFLNQENAWAFQSITGRLLESVRKGYWAPADEVQQKLAADYALSVVTKGVACCDHTCNNPQFNQMVLNIISLPGVMSPELVLAFKLAVEMAGQKTLEEMVRDRENLLKDLGEQRRVRDSNPARQAGPIDESVETESVRGLKMERMENASEETTLTSSGVEWTLSIFVLILIGIFFVGYRLRTRQRK
jgi:cobaltochelatase CobN